jgi:cytochrome c
MRTLEEKGSYVLMASYTDRGNANIQSITGREQILLRHPKIRASSFNDSSKDLRTDGDAVIEIYNGSYLAYEALDLTDIGAIQLDFWIRDNKDYGGKVELRLDGKQGQLLGTYDIKESGVGTINFGEVKGLHNVYALFSTSAGGDKQIVHFKSLEFVPREKVLQ